MLVTNDLAILDLDGECPNTPSGQIAIRATQKGIDYFAEHVASENVEQVNEISTDTRSTNMEIDCDVEMPTKGVTRKPSIPLEKMEVGNSIHFPVTEKHPTPDDVAKSKQGTVTARNGKHRTQVGENDKGKPVYEWSMRWAVRPVGDTDPKGPGARIFRTV
jgi:hypothetical protein